MTLLTPNALYAALLVIPILMLYMLRLRRREMMVSSHFLWRQVLQDTEANTPWQRLRRNLLLLLQLLILAFLVLALARPAQVVETLSAGRTVLLLDASASMSAADVDGTTRFEAAKTQARQIIGELGAGDEMTIVRVSDVTEPLTPYTGDGSILRQALDAAQTGQGGGDWQTALTLAAAGAEGAEHFNIIIISDGNIPVDAGKLPETIPQPVFIPVGQSTDNLAISALAARALPGQTPQLFAQVQNYGATDAPVSLVIRLDGELWESASQTIAANSQRSFVFSVDVPFSTAEANLVYGDDVTDYLALDDKAFTTTAEFGTRRALLLSEQGNRFLEQILGSIPGIQTFRGDVTQRLPEQQYDLYIFDGWLPEILPTGDMLIINPPRSTPLFSVGDVTENVENILVPERGHPLLTYVDFRAVNLRAFRPITEASWAVPLVQSDEGALLLAGDIEGRQVVIIPFNLRDSDLPLQIAFPILMSNVVEWFTPANVISAADSLRVGDTLPLHFPVNATAARVTLPDGTTQTLAPDSDAPVFASMEQPGLYTLSVDAGGSTQEYPFAVNLFGTGESDIAPQTAINVGGGEQATDADAQLSLREFWSIAALIALVILLLEWVLYHRRMQIPTTFRPLERTTARNR